MDIHPILNSESHYISEMALALTRVFFLLITVAMILYKLIIMGLRWFIFLTNISWVFVFLYFVSACIQSFAFTRRNEIHLYLFATVNCLGYLVTIVYWAALAPLQLPAATVAVDDKIHSVFAHLLNLVLPMMDLWLSKTRIRWKHFTAPIMTVTLYTCMVLILRYQFNVGWPYPFLNLLIGRDGFNPVGAVSFIGGVYVALTLFYWIVLKMIDFRDKDKEERLVMSPIPKETTLV